MIEAYSFGQMTVNGKQYTKDLIILPDGGILHPWWRKSGHTLTLDDLGPVIDASPDILIVGMGMSGMMNLHPPLFAELTKRNINLIAKPTTQAVKEYNSLLEQNLGVAACFHLTC